MLLSQQAAVPWVCRGWICPRRAHRAVGPSLCGQQVLKFLMLPHFQRGLAHLAHPHIWWGWRGLMPTAAKWRACSKKAGSLYSGLGHYCLRGREMKGRRAAESFSTFNTTRSRQFFGPELSFLPGHRLSGYVQAINS